MNDARLQQELSELITRTVEGDATPDEHDRLADLLTAHPHLVDDYVELLSLRAAIRFDAMTTAAPAPAHPSPAPHSPVRLASAGRTNPLRITLSVYVLSGIAAAVLITAAAVAVYLVVWHRPSTSEHRTSSAPVATLIDVSDGSALLVDNDIANPGDDYHPGRYSLESGSAQFQLTSGAGVTLRGDTELRLRDAMQLALERGEITVRCPPSAVGFTVNLPGDVRIVDLGTEFTVVTDASGGGAVSVREGSIRLECDGRSETYTAGSRVHWEPSAGRFVLTRGLGADDPTLAHWRFEDHRAGAWFLPAADPVSAAPAAVDAGPRGAHLYVFDRGTAPLASADIAADSVPAVGGDNRRSADFSPLPTIDHVTRDLYAIDPGLRDASLSSWTVEASVKPFRFNADGYMTVLCRDGKDVVGDDPALACLYLQLSPQGQPVIAFADAGRRFHKLVADDVTIAPDRWAHLAATCDGRTLTLYVDTMNGAGYRAVASHKLTPGDTTLATAGASWAVGRGWYDDKPADQFVGLIDEVRISAKALTPDRFLFASPRGANVAP